MIALVELTRIVGTTVAVDDLTNAAEPGVVTGSATARGGLPWCE